MPKLTRPQHQPIHSSHSPQLGGSSLLDSILNSFTVVSFALIVTSSPEGAVTNPPPLTDSCQTTTFCAPAGTFLISKLPLFVGHRDIRIVDHHPPGGHPGVDIANDLRRACARQAGKRDRLWASPR